MADKEKGKIKAQEVEAEIITGQEPEEEQALDFITKNRNLIFGGATAILVIIAGLIYWNQYKERQSTQASEEMFQAIYYFEQDSLNKALNGDGMNFGFLDIADTYSGTAAANQANYYIGVIYLQQGDLETGIDYLEDYKVGDDLLSMSAQMALAFAYEDLGNPGKAASLFEKAAYTPGANDKTTPTMLLHAGRNYEAAGKPKKALALYETIKEEYPFSSEGIRIEKYIGRVSN